MFCQKKSAIILGILDVEGSKDLTIAHYIKKGTKRAKSSNKIAVAGKRGQMLAISALRDTTDGLMMWISDGLG